MGGGGGALLLDGPVVRCAERNHRGLENQRMPLRPDRPLNLALRAPHSFPLLGPWPLPRLLAVAVSATCQGWKRRTRHHGLLSSSASGRGSEHGARLMESDKGAPSASFAVG